MEQCRDEKNPPRRLPPRKEKDCEAELEEIKKQLKKLCEGIDRVNKLLVECTRRQDSVIDEVIMQRDPHINRWWRVSHPTT